MDFKTLITIFSVFSLATLMGCQTVKPIETVRDVDLHRFMGKWYVVANIPTFFEKGAYNAVESYRYRDDGTISVAFTFNKGAIEGPLKTITSRGFVQDAASNAVWGMQFVWPFKAEYRIVYLNENYTQTVIGRSKRDYVWIMARTPEIPPADYESIVGLLGSLGYDVSKIQRIQHTEHNGQSGRRQP